MSTTEVIQVFPTGSNPLAKSITYQKDYLPPLACESMVISQKDFEDMAGDMDIQCTTMQRYDRVQH